jgi:hypothetical protein
MITFYDKVQALISKLKIHDLSEFGPSYWYDNMDQEVTFEEAYDTIERTFTDLVSYNNVKKLTYKQQVELSKLVQLLTCIKPNENYDALVRALVPTKFKEDDLKPTLLILHQWLQLADLANHFAAYVNNEHYWFLGEHLAEEYGIDEDGIDEWWSMYLDKFYDKITYTENDSIFKDWFKPYADANYRVEYSSMGDDMHMITFVNGNLDDADGVLDSVNTNFYILSEDLPKAMEQLLHAYNLYDSLHEKVTQYNDETVKEFLAERDIEVKE